MKTKEDIESLLKEVGAVAVRHNRNICWRLPNGKLFVTSKHPGDFRATQNSFSQLKRMLGDLMPGYYRSNHTEEPKPKVKYAPKVETPKPPVSIKVEPPPLLPEFHDKLASALELKPTLAPIVSKPAPEPASNVAQVSWSRSAPILRPRHKRSHFIKQEPQGKDSEVRTVPPELLIEARTIAAVNGETASRQYILAHRNEDGTYRKPAPPVQPLVVKSVPVPNLENDIIVARRRAELLRQEIAGLQDKVDSIQATIAAKKEEAAEYDQIFKRHEIHQAKQQKVKKPSSTISGRNTSVWERMRACFDSMPFYYFTPEEICEYIAINYGELVSNNTMGKRLSYDITERKDSELVRVGRGRYQLRKNVLGN